MTTFKNEPTNSPNARAIGMTALGAISIVMHSPKTLSRRLYAIWLIGDPSDSASLVDGRVRLLEVAPAEDHRSEQERTDRVTERIEDRHSDLGGRNRKTMHGLERFVEDLEVGHHHEHEIRHRRHGREIGLFSKRAEIP